MQPQLASHQGEEYKGETIHEYPTFSSKYSPVNP